MKRDLCMRMYDTDIMMIETRSSNPYTYPSNWLHANLHVNVVYMHAIRFCLDSGGV